MGFWTEFMHGIKCTVSDGCLFVLVVGWEVHGSAQSIKMTLGSDYLDRHKHFQMGRLSLLSECDIESLGMRTGFLFSVVVFSTDSRGTLLLYTQESYFRQPANSPHDFSWSRITTSHLEAFSFRKFSFVTLFLWRISS